MKWTIFKDMSIFVPFSFLKYVVNWYLSDWCNMIWTLHANFVEGWFFASHANSTTKVQHNWKFLWFWTSMRLSTEWNVMNHIFGVRNLLVFSKYLWTIVLRIHTLFSNHNTYHVYITWLSEAKVHIQTEWNICVHISLMQLYFLIECLLSKNIKVFWLLDLGIGNPIIEKESTICLDYNLN